jgi:hypothetical protein
LVGGPRAILRTPLDVADRNGVIGGAHDERPVSPVHSHGVAVALVAIAFWDADAALQWNRVGNDRPPDFRKIEPRQTTQQPAWSLLQNSGDATNFRATHIDLAIAAGTKFEKA